jgi:multidrug resistance efflux pump
VDVNSFWVQGFLQEASIRNIRAGDRATMTLMPIRVRPIEGSVDSLDWGGPHKEVSTGYELLPTVTPTFEWIRLAQGVPAFRRTRVEIFSIWTLNPTA